MKVKRRFGYDIPIMYKEKNPWSDIVDMLFKDNEFEVVDDSDSDWYLIRSEKGDGYVLKATMRRVK